MLTERYRIVGLLGTGGMGEVYRADDLKLRQPVALKFLPVALSRDTRRLERFHHEVRVARQVSHPNVCRVYDIGEADGQQFISMEYVDGEDLASVLRRMGRPSKDKAIQIARQLCAGLAAAHDKGVLHRDLKPHNVMVDERGKVRITDFGLAGFAEEFTGGEVSAGTPAYMAPVQLAGREVSVKSDLYGLGLVLFVLFTGQRAFEGATRQEIQRSRDETPPSGLSVITEDVDPAVERVVLRCLETQPGARPSSALAVAAALPGGDPLAAALEAGETPDPAMVVAAGEVGGLSPAIAVPCLIGVFVGLVAVALLNDPTGLFRQVTLAQPPQALAYQASEILQKLGHAEVAVDSAYGFGVDDDYLRYVEENDDSADRWEKLATNRPPAMYFWYRQSPRELIPPASEWIVTRDQPPPLVSGMAEVLLGPAGRLIELSIVPPQRDEPQATDSSQSTDWSLLFEAAQLEMSDFARWLLIKAAVTV
jgi:serine/threonine-protein kinase